jgi:hypothetical protein
MSLQSRLLIVVLLLYVGNTGAGFASSWEAVGPYGGHAQKIIMDPSNREHLYTMTKSGQIFQSIDAGVKWTRLPFPLSPASSLNAFAINPANANDLFVGVARNFAQTGDAGIFRSQDGGLHWTLLEQTTESSVLSIAIHPKQPNIVVAGTESGVLRSLDGGLSWKQISPPNHPKLKAVVSVAFDPTNSNVLYAGTTHLPWKTIDGGTTWQSIHLGMADDSDVFSIVVNPTDTQHVLPGRLWWHLSIHYSWRPLGWGVGNPGTKSPDLPDRAGSAEPSDVLRRDGAGVVEVHGQRADMEAAKSVPIHHQLSRYRSGRFTDHLPRDGPEWIDEERRWRSDLRFYERRFRQSQPGSVNR